MMDIRFNLFPEGRARALTMSYDDGRTADRRLVGIFNAHGIRGTFHLNSGKLDALHSLTIGARMDMIHNGSALDVWVSVDDKPVCIGAGEPGNFHKIKKGQGDVAFI